MVRVVPVNDTRQQMIATAVRLFQRDGYQATSWRRLVQEAGTPWGSAHHHFPGGKEQLGVAAIELGGDMVAALIEHAFAEARTPAAAIDAWFAASAAMLEASDFRDGCPVATVALEVSPDTTPLATACAAALQRWHALVARHLKASGISSPRAKELATATLAGFEGALLLARTLRSTEALRIAAAALGRELAVRPCAAVRRSR